MGAVSHHNNAFWHSSATKDNLIKFINSWVGLKIIQIDNGFVYFNRYVSFKTKKVCWWVGRKVTLVTVFVHFFQRSKIIDRQRA